MHDRGDKNVGALFIYLVGFFIYIDFRDRKQGGRETLIFVVPLISPFIG